MTRFTRSMCLLTLCGLSISGMAFASGNGQTPVKTLLRSDATTQLNSAVAAVNAATRAKALWIPAQEALEKARSDFGRGNYVEAIEQANLAKRLAELGLKQSESPPYRHF